MSIKFTRDVKLELLRLRNKFYNTLKGKKDGKRKNRRK